MQCWNELDKRLENRLLDSLGGTQVRIAVPLVVQAGDVCAAASPDVSVATSNRKAVMMEAMILVIGALLQFWMGPV